MTLTTAHLDDPVVGHICLAEDKHLVAGEQFRVLWRIGEYIGHLVVLGATLGVREHSS